MNLILLPGNTDRSWIKEIKKIISSLFDNSYLVEYAHHRQGKNLINLEYELVSLNKLIQDNSINDYVIFAKSAGTLLTLEGVCKGILKPKKCIFLGVPINWAYNHIIDIDKWITHYSTPTLFIQQTNDPYYSYNELQEYLGKSSVKNGIMHKVEGNNHHYSNIEEIKRIIEKFI